MSKCDVNQRKILRVITTRNSGTNGEYGRMMLPDPVGGAFVVGGKVGLAGFCTSNVIVTQVFVFLTGWHNYLKPVCNLIQLELHPFDVVFHNFDCHFDVVAVAQDRRVVVT